ncbi:MAG: transglycosylase domain-containing protein [bacterium]|uniref:Transglycosylase domain-containing protein n=1 Tax=Candidatus Aphodosoma intestinipullorum TaxID=2840674 RepID=A0A940DLD5_9BACT|nr:transglycosylase domain-containing protein [Candidatus Aphodosoma intestinipullorum]
MVQRRAKSALTAKQKKTFLVWFWGLFAAAVLVVAGIFVAIAYGWIGYLPPIEELQNPKNKFATEIYSSDGELIGTFYTAKDNRINANYNELSPNLVKALIATEDIRFESHSGIDAKAIARAAILRGLFQMKGAGGGSTLTQQLAKQLYSPMAENIVQRAMQKPIEWVIAVELERLYTKEEILTMYLNKFDFLNNAVGIKTASNVYFGVPPSDLTVEQAATLVGMCKNPSLYNPVSAKRRPKCEERRNVVLSQMHKAGYLTQAEYDSIRQIPLTLDYHRVDHKLGMAPYFREYLRKTLTAKEPKKKNYASWQLAPYGQYYLDSIEWADNPLYGFCEKNPKKDGTKYDIYRDGLKIYTTIDSRMQLYAEQAVEEHMKEMQAKFFKSQKGRKKAPFASSTSDKDIERSLNQAMRNTDRYRALKKAHATEEEIREAFETPVEMEVFSYDGIVDTVMSPMDSIRYHKYFARCGMMSIDPLTGYVKAYIGGPDFSYFQYDMATVGRRQVGSTVKPYLYSLAMSEGYWPCDTTINQEITLYDGLGRPFTPRNSSKARVGETVTFKWGLQTSNNWITAYLMSLLSPDQLVKLMRSFGIKGELVPVISLCLGPCEVSVAEMVDAYTVFPNKGIRTEALYVTHIEDNNGNRIAEFVPRTEEVLSEETTYKMLDMLTAVMDHGTGIRVRYRYNINAPAGGKTGTSQENSDGWFMGFTPSLVSGVWVGWEDRTVHFANMADGQGASMALPIWAKYMQRVLNDSTLGYDATQQFDIPEWFDPNAGCR